MTKERIEQFIEKVSEVLKYVYIIHIILAFCSYTADSWITGVTPLLVLGLGGIVLLYRLIHIKEYKNYPFIWLYVLFVALYGVSALVNIRYGFMDNLKIMIWMALQFGTLYLCDINKTRDQIYRELKRCLYVIVATTSIMNLIGVGMLFLNFCDFWTGNDGVTYLVGIAYWGRLYGVHVDPNYGAVQTIVAMVAAAFLFLKTNKNYKKVIYGLSILLNMLHLTFCGSRTGIVALMVMTVVYGFLYVFHLRKKFLPAFLLAIVCVITVLGANKGIEEGYNAYVGFMKENDIHIGFAPDGEPSDELVEIGREEEINEDVSNRRFDLWGNALQVVATTPIFGTTFGNLVPYCMEKLPECYILTNDYTVFNAFHNMFMDLLASQGIVGTLVFLTIVILSLIYAWKSRKLLPEEDKHTCCFLFSVCAGMIVASLFVSEILYVHNQITVLFWMMWGFLIYFFFANVRDKEKEVAIGE